MNMPDKPPQFNPETAPPGLEIDWDAYLPFFEDEDISEADKRELIEALWSIVVSFVDLGFGVHPVQQACGQDVSLAELPMGDVVQLNPGSSLSTSYNAVSDNGQIPKERSPAWR